MEQVSFTMLSHKVQGYIKICKNYQLKGLVSSVNYNKIDLGKKEVRWLSGCQLENWLPGFESRELHDQVSSCYLLQVLPT